MNSKNIRHISPENLSAYKICLIAALVWGLLAHGMALTNKIILFDEITYLFGVGVTTSSGRWFLEVLGKFAQWLFGSPNFSLPLWGGLINLLLAGLCSCVLVSWLSMKTKLSRILCSGLVVTFPILAGLFFYNFTAPYYLFALLLTFLGGKLLSCRRSAAAFLGGTLLVTLGLSVYQAFLPLLLCLFLIAFLQKLLQDKTMSAKVLFREIGWYVLSCIAIAALYLLSVKLSTALAGEGLSNYKGISTMGGASPAEYIHRIKLALYLFMFPTKTDRYAFSLYYRLLDCYYLALAAILVLSIRPVLRLFRESPLKGAVALAVYAVFPLATNFIYIVCETDDVYNLMLFGLLGPFLLLLCLAEWQAEKPSLRRFQKIAGALLAVFCLFSVRIDNAIYTKGILYQTRTTAYFTTLVANIKATPGYTGKTPVAFVGDTYLAMDPTFHSLEGFGGLSMAPLAYDASPFNVGHNWKGYLDLLCGFSPEYVDGKPLQKLPAVQAMPCYPDAGSIQMVDGVLVVKLLSPDNQ